MPGKAFVDTNILLRALHDQFAQHPQAKALIDDQWDRGVELWVSRQVIREYLVQVTHPSTFVEPLTQDQVFSQIRNIRALFFVADDTDAVTDRLIALLTRYPTRGKLIHDANLVATMLENGIDTLLTLNIKDLARFVPLITLVTIETPA